MIENPAIDRPADPPRRDRCGKGEKGQILAENNQIKKLMTSFSIRPRMVTAAEEQIATKRADYFAAGTLVVWDVDPVNEVIRVYRAAQSGQFTEYRRGQVAEAEPAVPGWRVSVDWIFG